MKLRLFALVLCTVGISVSQGMELTKDNNTQKILSHIQYIPQDITLDMFSFADYPTLAQSRRVCKNWNTLIDEKLPLSQRYILKYLAQFVQKKTPKRTLKRFEEIFLAPVSEESVGKTALDDIIDELQDELSTTKEQAYQALLNSKLVSTCPSIKLQIYIDDKLKAKRQFAFSYIPANLMKQDRESVVNQDIELGIIGLRESPMQIFGISNLPAKILGKVRKVHLDNINLLKIPRQLQKLQRLTVFSLNNSKLNIIPAEIGQLTNLQTLYLNNNQLSSISAEIGQLTNLQTLYLYNNQLSSTPAEIGQLTTLYVLSLSNNQLSSIPTKIKQLTNLKRLDLSHNQLSSIPAEIKEALPNCDINI